MCVRKFEHFLHLIAKLVCVRVYACAVSFHYVNIKHSMHMYIKKRKLSRKYSNIQILYLKIGYLNLTTAA